MLSLQYISKNKKITLSQAPLDSLCDSDCSFTFILENIDDNRDYLGWVVKRMVVATEVWYHIAAIGS